MNKFLNDLVDKFHAWMDKNIESEAKQFILIASPVVIITILVTIYL